MPRCFGLLRSATVIFAACVAVIRLLFPSAATAQYPDTYTVPSGVLRWSFEPSYTSWNHLFDLDGVAYKLGRDLSPDSAGVNFFPSLYPVRDAVRSITGDSAYRINAGAFRTALDADVRRFPFNFQLGLSDRLTVTASIPVLYTRMQTDFTADSTEANVGWNQVSATSGTEYAAALSQVTSLLAQLQAAADFVDAIISAGGLDCPSGPQCENARDLVDRGRRMYADISALTGVDASGNPSAALPPFAPLSSSAAGKELTAAIQTIAAELQALGAPAVTATLPLPSDVVGTEDIQTVLSETTAGFGYDALKLEFAKYRQKLGDIELGLRMGLLQRQSVRAVFSTTVRLPTGTMDRPDHFLDIGTGDRQTDFEAGIEAALDPGGPVSLALAASYNLQLGDRVVRRLAPPHSPIALAAAEQQVSRNLGDVLRIAVFPALQLNPAFRAYGAVEYYRKGLDSYSGTDFQQPGLPTVTAAELGDESSMSRLSVGGGIHFRSRGRDATSLPAEAGIHYQAAYHGSGGLTPKTTVLHFYLRIFNRLFGGAGESEEPEETQPEPPPPATPPPI